jgi:hypothetical protein
VHINLAPNSQSGITFVLTWINGANATVWK